MSMAKSEEPVRTMTRELEVQLWDHPGKWVAVTETELVAAAATADEVHDAAVRKGWAPGSYAVLRLPEPGKLYVY